MNIPSVKIAILSSFLHHASGFGGIIPWLVNLANGFFKKGFSVDILVNASSRTSLIYEPINERIPIINLGYHKISAILGLLAYLKENSPDVLLSAGYRYNNMALLAYSLDRKRTKCFLSVHENITYGSKKLKSLKTWLRFALIRKFYPIANGVVAVSQGVAQDLFANFDVPEDKVRVIYNPIVNRHIEILANEEPDHPWLQEKQLPVVLGVGRLEKQKMFDLLIRSFSEFTKYIPSKLIIIGEGKERPILEHIIFQLGLQNDVALPGFVKNPFAFMRKADLFVLSSAWEGFGNVIVEALATGTPVVSTDCPSGPREILNHGEFGPLVKVGDTEALTRAMLFVIQNPPDKKTLVQRGNCFDVESGVRAYLNYFDVF